MAGLVGAPDPSRITSVLRKGKPLEELNRPGFAGDPELYVEVFRITSAAPPQSPSRAGSGSTGSVSPFHEKPLSRLA
jgi:hypothetical protein